MPVLGLVLVLDDGAPAIRAGVHAALTGARDLDLGDPVGHRWPAVLESADQRDVDAVRAAMPRTDRIDTLRSVRGIAAIDVVYADFEDLLAQAPTSAGREEA